MPRFWMLTLVASLGLTSACGAESNATQPTSVVSIKVNFVGHQVDPPQSVYQVGKDKDVRIEVNSSTADEVYVHGYDKKVVVQANYPATVEFIADKAGRFDVEMRQSHVRLFQLKVS